MPGAVRRWVGCIAVMAAAALSAQTPAPAPTASPEILRAGLDTLSGRERMNALLALANSLETNAPDEAQVHVREGLALAQSFGDKEMETAFLTTGAYCCIQTGDFHQAIEQGRKALALADATGNKARAGKAHNILGTAYVFMGVYSSALEEGMEALRVREELGQEHAIAMSLNLIGVIYHRSGQYEKAIEYYDHILRRLETKPDARRAILARLNKGFSQYKLGRLEEALHNHLDARNVAVSSGETAYDSYMHLMLGLTYTDLGRLDRAREHLAVADREYRGQNQKHGLVQVLNARARLALKGGNSAAGVPMAEEAVALAIQINARDERLKGHELLAELHARLGNGAEAARQQRLAQETRDSIYTTQETTRIAVANMKLVALQKDFEIQALKRERLINDLSREKQRYVVVILVGGMGFMGIILALLVRYTRRMRAARTSLQRSNAELQEKINEIRTLSGLLPICCHCKKIRDDEGYWNQLEGYISERTAATFSHGICPTCVEKHYPEVAEDVRGRPAVQG